MASVAQVFLPVVSVCISNARLLAKIRKKNHAIWRYCNVYYYYYFIMPKGCTIYIHPNDKKHNSTV